MVDSWWRVFTAALKRSLAPRQPRRRNRRHRDFSRYIAVCILERRELLAGFTPGNLVISTIGTGATLDASATVVTLREYGLDSADTPTTATLVNSLSAPSANAGSNSGNLTNAGSAATEGTLNLSTDGSKLTLLGYDAPEGLANLTATTASANNRSIGVADASGTLTVGPRLTDAFSTSNARAAASVDGSKFWVGGNTGVRYVGTNAAAPTTSTALITSSPPSTRFVTIATDQTGKQFLVGNSAATVFVWTTASLPTTATAQQSLTLTGLGSDLGEIVMLDRSPTLGATGLGGIDTIYVTNGQSSTTGSISKYEWTGSAWASRSSRSYTNGLNGLTARVTEAGNVQLLATTRLSNGDNQLVTRIDTSAFGSDISLGSYTVLATSGAGYGFRGVAFTPDEAISGSLTPGTAALANAGGAPVNLLGDVTWNDGSTFNGGSLTISGTANGDVLSLANVSGKITTSGNAVLFNGTIIGQFSGGNDNNVFRVDFNSRNDVNRVSKAMVEQLLEQLQFTTISGASSRLLSVNLKQAADQDSHVESFTAAQTIAINQPPSQVQLTNATTSLAENTNVPMRLKLADITVVDDNRGVNVLGLTGADANAFEIVGQELFLKAGTVLDYESKSSYSVTVTVDDPAAGTAPDATVSYTLTLTDLAEPPEIGVAVATVDVPDGTAFDFGSVDVGVTVSRTFSVTNTGIGPLTLQPVIITGSAFSLASSNFTAGQSLAVNATVTFTIAMNTSTAGTKFGTVTFLNDDLDEAVYNIDLNGTVTEPVIVPVLLDDGDAGFSLTGSWETQTGGYGNDTRAAGGNDGTKTATWVFTGLTSGTYQIDATWLPGSDRASNAPYVVRDGVGGSILSVFGVNQRVLPSGARSDGGRPFAHLETVTVTNGTLVVGLSNNGTNGAIFADAVRIERLPIPPSVPRLEVKDGATAVWSGTTLSVGSAPQGSVALTKTLTVRNAGIADLLLQPISLTGTGYTLVTPNFTAGQVLAPNATVNITVQLSTGAVGTFPGTLSFGHNAGSPFVLPLSATISPLDLALVDDGDAGFSLTGAWETQTSGYGNDTRAVGGSDGTKTATWTFTGLTAGTYQIDATWSPAGDRANNAPYIVRDGAGGTILSAFSVNQRALPSGARSDGGRPFAHLQTVTVTNGTLVISLSNNGTNGAIFADAMRIERLSPVPFAPRLDVKNGATPLWNNGNLNFGTGTQGGTAPTRTITVRNTGTADLVLQPLSLTGTAFSLVTPNFTDSKVLGPNETVDIVVQLSAATAGSFASTLSFGHNAGGSFVLPLSGVITTPPPVGLAIIDDGDAGFALTGGWESQNGSGYGADVKAVGGNSGTNQAAWTFAGLTAGTYQIDATWTPGSDRASNAPYKFLDGVGGTIIGNAVVNQRVLPAGADSAGGRPFASIGTVTVTGTTLVVQLANAATNGAIFADAIRIFRVV